MTDTLVTTLWPRARTAVAAKAALVLLGAALIALSSKVQVPFWPVPMTLQTLAVLLVGASYGARLAASTLAAWLAAGALGLPVFATGAGLAYMAGPTGGYLAGFFIAAVIAGALADRGALRSRGGTLAALALGEVAIFGLGTGWLAMAIGAEKAVAAGLLPFVPAEILKMALAAALLMAARRRPQS